MVKKMSKKENDLKKEETKKSSKKEIKPSKKENQSKKSSNELKKSQENNSQVKTIKLYEAIFIGVAILLLVFLVLIKYVTPNL